MYYQQHIEHQDVIIDSQVLYVTYRQTKRKTLLIIF